MKQKADEENLKTHDSISSEGTSICNLSPSEILTQGQRKEKDTENVTLYIAPSSFLKCNFVCSHIQLS